jgi:hypothetical protein
MIRHGVPTIVGVVAALVLAGCTRPATLLVVSVDSDLPLERRACVHVEVLRVDEPDVTTETFFHASSDRTPRGETPFSFSVTPPAGDARRRVEIRVSALREGDACRTDTSSAADVVVTRRVRTGFLPEQALLVPVFLADACVDVACGTDETCDAGRCVPADVDPGTLRPVRPGEELSDAGPARDAGPPRDAPALDAGPVETDFAPTLPSPTYTLDLMGSQPAYPVGVAGADRVIVAGFVTEARSLGATMVPANSLWLASLSPTGVPDWVTSASGPSYPWPQVQRVVPYGDGFVMCASVQGSITPQVGGAPAPTSCSARPCVILARLDATGAFTEVRALDAPAGEVWCTDLEVRGNRAYVGARTFEVGALTIDGTATTARGTLDAAQQNILRFTVDDVAGAFAPSAPTVVGHNPATFGVMFGYPGSPLLVRGDGAGGEVLATTADALSLAGAAPGGTVAVRVARFDASGAELWSIPSLVTLSSDAGATLHAIEVSGGVVWVALTIEVGSPGRTARFGSLAARTVDRATGFLVALDLATGAVRSATDTGPGSGAGGEDRFISTPISSMLFGGGLAATGAQDVLFAGTVTMGDAVGGAARTVSGERDGLVSILGPDGAARAVWQWDGRPEMDVRLTHVQWLPGGWVAVGGYVENDSETWGRAASFLAIHPAR